MTDKQVMEYVRLWAFSKRSRVRKKALTKLQRWCGYDKEGIIHYAKLVPFVEKLNLHYQ